MVRRRGGEWRRGHRAGFAALPTRWRRGDFYRSDATTVLRKGDGGLPELGWLHVRSDPRFVSTIPSCLKMKQKGWGVCSAPSVSGLAATSLSFCYVCLYTYSCTTSVRRQCARTRVRSYAHERMWYTGVRVYARIVDSLRFLQAPAPPHLACKLSLSVSHARSNEFH